jgi:GAF domain-containing protein
VNGYLQRAERIQDVQYTQRDVEDALSKVLHDLTDHLFLVLRQADRCFVVLRDEATGQLTARVVKARRQQPGVSPGFSRTIVRNCFDRQQPALIQGVATDGTFSLSQPITDFRIRSVMCVPVAVGGKPVGVIQLDSRDRGRMFTEEDLKLLCDAVASAESLIPIGIPPSWLSACLPRPVSDGADQPVRGG